jgi:hypothetical protein
MTLIKHTKNRKAKKEHLCNFCCEKIDVGELYDYQFNTDGNEAWEFKSHLDCLNLYSRLRLDYSDDFDSDWFSEDVRSELLRIIDDETKYYSDFMNLNTHEQVKLLLELMEQEFTREG